MEPIEPVLRPLRAFSDSRGYSYFDIFGELDSGQINIGHLQPGVVKGLHYHLAQNDLWFCLKGDIHVVCARPKQPVTWLMPYTAGTIDETDIRHYYIGEHNPAVLVIPISWQHGYCNVSNEESTLLYWVTKGYDPTSPDEYRIPWDHYGAEIWKPENK